MSSARGIMMRRETDLRCEMGLGGAELGGGQGQYLAELGRNDPVGGGAHG